MSELTDDQLDGLFRKSAEEFEPPIDPAAWPDMSARLDASDRTSPDSRTLLMQRLLRWGLPVVLLLLLFVGGWYVSNRVGFADKSVSPNTAANKSGLALVDKKVRGNETRLANTNATEPSTERGQLKTGGGQEEEASRFSEEERDASIDKEQVSVANPASIDQGVAGKPVTVIAGKDGVGINSTSPVKPESAFHKPAFRQKRADKSRLVTLSPRRGATNSTAETLRKEKNTKKSGTPIRQSSKTGIDRKGNPVLAIDYTLKNTPLITQLDKSTNNESSQTQITASENDATSSDLDASVVVTLPALTELASRPAVWSRPVPLTDYPVTAPAPEKVVERVSSVPVKTVRGLSIRFVISPDLSAVGLKNFTRPGTNVGLLLEYRLAARWSVQAGVMQSTKVYKAATSDYAMPAYTTKWPVQPIGVDGTCNMIDIPLNIRYDVALRPRQNGQAPSRWFVSGGVTSYIMKQEDYAYKYADPADPRINPKNMGWSGSTGMYGFSELNLSAGYERAINRRFSWQVEPYLKVPLKEVGYYKINLLSTGGFFSLRYKF